MSVVANLVRWVYRFDCYKCKVQSEVINPSDLSNQRDASDPLPDLLMVDMSFFTARTVDQIK